MASLAAWGFPPTWGLAEYAQAFADALKMGQVDPLGTTLSMAHRLKALRKHLAAQLAHRLAQIDLEAAVGTTLMTRKGA